MENTVLWTNPIIIHHWIVGLFLLFHCCRYYCCICTHVFLCVYKFSVLCSLSLEGVLLGHMVTVFQDPSLFPKWQHHFKSTPAVEERSDISPAWAALEVGWNGAVCTRLPLWCWMSVRGWGGFISLYLSPKLLICWLYFNISFYSTGKREWKEQGRTQCWLM